MIYCAHKNASNWANFYVNFTPTNFSLSLGLLHSPNLLFNFGVCVCVHARVCVCMCVCARI